MEEEKKEINQLELKNNLFTKIKSIHDYFKEKLNKENILNINQKLENNENIINLEKDDNNDNIYIKYLKNPNIIFQDKGDINNKNLKLLFDELNIDLDNKNNILFPFLDICSNLVSAYIESDLDDFNYQNDEVISLISKSKYLKTFIKIKNNCFINKETLIPIYSYFSNLYEILTKSELKLEEISFKKLCKVIKLFEVFYEIEQNKNLSTFCFIGGNIDIEFNQEIQLSKENQIFIKIYFVNYDYIEFLNDNLYFIKINEKEIKYKEFRKNKEGQKLEFIKNININSKKNMIIEFLNKKCNIEKKIETNTIKKISLLEEFYGQISSIQISIGNDKNKIEYVFVPLSIRNDNSIFYLQKSLIGEKSYTLNNIIPKIIINNKNFVNINNINYNNIKYN